MKKLINKNDKNNTILFVVLVPDEVDRNWDIITEQEITKTAHDFVINLTEKKVNIDHEDKFIEDAVFVESFVAPNDIIVEKEVIPKGSWLVWIKFNEDVYNEIKKGEYVGISMEWLGYVD